MSPRTGGLPDGGFKGYQALKGYQREWWGQFGRVQLP